MMLGLAALLMSLQAGPVTSVGEWKIACVDTAKLDDGKFDTCTMTTKSGPVSVEIIRTAEGVATTVTQKGCKPPHAIAPVTRTQEQLAGEGGNKMLLGTIIESLMQNQMACRARGGALAIPLTEPEAAQLLETTSGIRSL